MTTQAEFVDPAFKKLLSMEDFRDRLVDYLREYVRENMERVFTDDGVFGASKMTLAGSAADTIDVTPTDLTIATDGRGYLLDVGAVGVDTEYSGQIKSFLFENNNNVAYHVSYQTTIVPRGIVINPRNGLPQYSHRIEAIGRRAEPDAVTDNGDGTITFNINTACDGAGHSWAGRRALVFLKTPSREAILESIAMETLTITWNGVNNRITTSGALGQAVISTTASDYEVVVLGPTVSKADTSGEAGHAYIGAITGTGAGTTPGSGDNTNQNLIDTSLSTVIQYPGGPAWADGTTNPANTITGQLDKIVADLTSTTGQRGAGKLTAPALASWADGTSNPATRLDLALTKIITDLATTAGNGGAARVGIGARTAWLGGRTNPATTSHAAIDKIITDLAAQGAGDDGAKRVGIAPRNDWRDSTPNPATSVYAAIDKIITDLGAALGAGRVGADAYGPGNFTLAEGSVASQLAEIADHLDNLRPSVWPVNYTSRWLGSWTVGGPSGMELASAADGNATRIPLTGLPPGARIDAINVRIDPGGARVSPNRTKMGLFRSDQVGAVTTVLALTEEPAANGNAQHTWTLSLGSPHAFAYTHFYYISVVSGNDGGAHNADIITAMYLTLSYP